MRLRLGRLTLLALVLDGTDPARAQEAEPLAPAIVVPVRAERVEVDLVVRDKRGGLVRDLRADEVEVFEDGVRQEVESLAFVERAPAGPATESPVFLALVFDRLGPAARRFARQAALAYLSGDRVPGTELGVFAIDRGLSVLEPFTDDIPAVRGAVEAMTSLGSTTLAGKRERELSRNAYHGLGEGLGQAHVAAAESRGAPECRGPDPPGRAPREPSRRGLPRLSRTRSRRSRGSTPGGCRRTSPCACAAFSSPRSKSARSSVTKSARSDHRTATLYWRTWHPPPPGALRRRRS